MSPSYISYKQLMLRAHKNKNHCHWITYVGTHL